MADIVKLSDSGELAMFDPDILQRLHDRASEVKSVKTPASQIEYKGEFPYAKWSYMLEQMDALHPLRKEVIVGEYFNEKYLIYHISVQVTDLITGESRSGVGDHPVIAFHSEKKGGAMMDVKDIRQQMSNASKAALTSALRNAYSNFGVAADLYDSAPSEPPTQEQIAKWEVVSVEMDEMSLSLVGSSYWSWWTKNQEIYKTQTKESFDEFFNQIEPTVTKLWNSFQARRR